MNFVEFAFWISLGVVTLSLESVSEHPVVSEVGNDSREGKYLSEVIKNNTLKVCYIIVCSNALNAHWRLN